MNNEYTPEEDIIKSLKVQLDFREIEYPKDANDFFIKEEIKKAIGEINRCRHFTPTKEKPYDIKYEDLIIPMCVFSFAKIGVEGENSHSENGVQRIYKGDGDYPEDLINKIVPLAK